MSKFCRFGIVTARNTIRSRGPIDVCDVRLFTGSSLSPSRIEYVHPLSQIVLEHLQSIQQDWVEEDGLSELVIRPDGTFEMRLPSYPVDHGRIWYVLLLFSNETEIFYFVLSHQFWF